MTQAEFSALASEDFRSIGQPFRGEIYEFIASAPMGKGHRNEGLPFDISTANYLRPVFRAIKNDLVRKVVIKAGVKTLKTFVVECAIAWHCAHGEGDIGFYLADIDAARDHAKSRFWDWFWSIGELARMRLTVANRFADTTTAIYFPDKTLRVWPLNESATQNINLAMVALSDAFLAGSTGMIGQMIARTTQYKDVRKILIESQGGVEDDDFDHQWRDTDMGALHVRCPLCKEDQPFEWERLRPDDFPIEALRGKYSGMKRGDEIESTKLPDGEYNEKAILRNTFYECYDCGGRWKDDGEFGPTRVALDESSHYVQNRKTALPGHVGFSWPAWINRRLEWGDLMLQYLKAKQLQRTRGNSIDLQTWYQKVAGQTWNPRLADEMRRRSQNTYDVGLSKNDAWKIGMFIDNQKNLEQQWVMVVAFKQDGSARQLWRGSLNGLSECRKKQLEFGVNEKGRPIIPDQHVFLDGRYRPDQICSHIIQNSYGHWATIHGERTWLCWNLMQGSRSEYQTHSESKDKNKKFIVGDPNWREFNLQGYYVEILIFPFSKTACGERFEASRDGRGAETLFLERQPGEPLDENELSHHSQIHAMQLVESKSFEPRAAKMKWIPVPASRPEHYHALWCMVEAVKEIWQIDGCFRSEVAIDVKAVS